MADANYVLLEKITVGAAGASSVSFTGIPQTGYTDLVLKVSGRSAYTSLDEVKVTFNGSATSYSYRSIFGDGSSAASYGTGGSAISTYINIPYFSGTSQTANTFTNSELYIPNYTGSNNKSVNVDSVQENNTTAAYSHLAAALWSNTSAITSITLQPVNGPIAANSTFYLYGVAKLGTTPAIVPYATGGDTIMTDGTYWYHAFKSSGTFTPAVGKNLSCDVLVVAGGGGGGAGGGGAGGYRTTTALSVSTATTVTVGAGGSGATTANNSTNGNDSVFSSITSTGGGAGKISISPTAGGSGAGGTAQASSGSAGTVTGGVGNTPSTSPSQGNDGGLGALGGTSRGSGGGGGAGAVGGNGVADVGGNGGAGLNTLSSWLSTTGLGVSGYVAGGGGGGSGSNNPGSGGAGGGGAGGNAGNAVAGTANTGGGGGGVYANYPGSSGGSGLVIVRYAV
jgi:hypothetical protein